VAADKAGNTKKVCPSDGTEFPARFEHCPQCGAKVEGERATPDPVGNDAIRSTVASVLEEFGFERKQKSELVATKRKKAEPVEAEEWL